MLSTSRVPDMSFMSCTHAQTVTLDGENKTRNVAAEAAAWPYPPHPFITSTAIYWPLFQDNQDKLGLPRWAGTRKVKPIWILLKQKTVSGSGISGAICKSAPCSRQITTPAPHQSVFYRLDALPATQPTASKDWRHINICDMIMNDCTILCCSVASGCNWQTDGVFTTEWTTCGE